MSSGAPAAGLHSLIHEITLPHIPVVDLKVLLASTPPPRLFVVDRLPAALTILSTAVCQSRLFSPRLVRGFRALEVGQTLVWIGTVPPDARWCVAAGGFFVAAGWMRRPGRFIRISFAFWHSPVLMVAYGPHAALGHGTSFYPRSYCRRCWPKFCPIGPRVFFAVACICGRRTPLTISVAAGRKSARLMGGEGRSGVYRERFIRVRGQNRRQIFSVCMSRSADAQGKIHRLQNLRRKPRRPPG